MSRNRALIRAWNNPSRDTLRIELILTPMSDMEMGVIYADTPVLCSQSTLAKVVKIGPIWMTFRHCYGPAPFGRTAKFRSTEGRWYRHPDHVSSKTQLSDVTVRFLESRIQRHLTQIKLNNLYIEEHKGSPMNEFYKIENEILKQTIKNYETRRNNG